MYLSVVIPAYNEAKRIGATLESVGTWLNAQSYDSEIVVVDNHSTDGTADIVHQYHTKFPFIRIITEKKQGKGHAVASGMLFATGEVRLFMDADNSTTVDHFEIMQPFLGEYDVVIGSLAVPGSVVLSGSEESWWRRVLGKLGNLWIQLWAVPGVWDTQRGFKICTARAAREIFPRTTIGGWGFDVEMLAIARAHRYRIKEMPITWKNGPGSKVSFWTYPQVFCDTVRVGLNRIRGML